LAEDEEYSIEKRKIPPQYIEDRGPEIVASTLAPQLGSDSETLTQGKIDMSLLSVIEKEDRPLLIFSHIRGRKFKIWRDIFDLYLKLNVSVGGRGRRDIIRMEGVARGGLPSVEAEIPKPGVLARNIWDRKWKEHQRENEI